VQLAGFGAGYFFGEAAYSVGSLELSDGADTVGMEVVFGL